MSDPAHLSDPQQPGDLIHGDKAEGDLVHGDKITITGDNATVIIGAVADTVAAITEAVAKRQAAGAPAPTAPAGAALTLQMLIAAPLVHISGGTLQPVTALEVIAELDAIRDACEEVEPPVALEIGVTIATAEALGRMLATRTRPLDILHFTGHGALGDAGVALVLENDLGATRLMDAGELHALLAPLQEVPCRLAFVSACHSEGVAQALLRAGVAHVIAINADDPVLDLAARTFAQRLYPALLAGRSVAEAFALARAAVLSDDTLHTLLDPATLQPVAMREALKFRLLPEEDARHQQPLVAATPAGLVRFVRPPWENTNLTATSPDPFVGRRQELYQLAELLGQNGTRCVAVHGPGGMGKTALTLAAGRWQHERARFRDGVWLVELRNVATVAQARTLIATVLDLDPKVGESDQALATALRDQRALLILDDLDILLQNDRQSLVDLLRALLSCRRLRLLTTSRQDLSGQVAHQRLVLTRLQGEDALRAFRDYAPPVAAWGQWRQEELAQLMAFLDGYPFPIRLAGQYMSATRCDLPTLLARLTANPRGTMRYQGDAEDRDTSLAATLDLSYHALPPEAQAMLPKLALFPAGLSRQAARAILGDGSETALETLLQYGMAEYRDEAGYQRFALPEPARRYAEGLQEDGLLDAVAPAALDYWYQLIDAGNDLIVAGKILEGRLLITLEQPNLRRFLAWGYAHEQRDDERSVSARATALLGNYWTATSTKQQPEVRESLDSALVAARRTHDSFGEANTLQAIGDVQQFRDERTAALDSYQQALTLYRATGSKLGEANTLKAIGDVQQFHKDPAALDSYTQALALYKAVGDRLGEANTLKAIGDVQQLRDERTAALDSYTQALALFRAVGAKLGEANILVALGQLDLVADKQVTADHLLDQAIAIYQAIGSRYSVPAMIGNYGWTLRRLGRYAQATSYLLRAADLFTQMGLTDYALRHQQAAEDNPIQRFEPLTETIAAIARGNNAERPAVETRLADLETKGWMLRAPVERIWAGERDSAALTRGLDSQDSAVIQRLLEILTSDT